MKVFMESMLILSQVYFFATTVRKTQSSNVPLIIACFGIMATAILTRYYM